MSTVLRELGIKEIDAVSVYGSIGEVRTIISMTNIKEMTMEFIQECYLDLAIDPPSTVFSAVMPDVEPGSRQVRLALRELKNILSKIELSPEYGTWLNGVCELRAKQELVTPLAGKKLKVDSDGSGLSPAQSQQNDDEYSKKP